MVASPTRDPLNKENESFPVPVRAGEFRLAEESRPASICSFSTFRLKVVITYGIPPAIHDDVHIHNTPSTAIESVPNSSGHTIAYRWCSLPRAH